MSPSTGRPRHHPERAGGRAAASTAAEGLCDRPEPKAEDAVESTNFAKLSPRRGLLCDRRRREHRPGPGGPDPVDEQGTTWEFRAETTSGAARAQGPARRAVRYIAR
jgi:hypothetical protein